MSLTRQLWLTIALVMLLAFGGAFTISTLAARHYLQEQLYLKNVDNAASLALSMSQLPKDPVTLELQLSAQFDAGHYRRISLSGADGKTMLEKTDARKANDAPDWFVRMVPLNIEAGVAQIQDGWKQFGTITIESHHGYAYSELWHSTVRLTLWCLAATLACGMIGSVLLRSILKPLRAVVGQAEAIGARKFISIDEPRTLEFRSVVRAMNTLSERVRGMVTEESRRVDDLRRQIEHDAVTGLLNREPFLARLDNVLSRNDARATGTLVMVRLNNLSQLNEEIGHLATDALLKRLGEWFSELDSTLATQSGRLNGSEFCLVSHTEELPEQLAEQVARGVHRIFDVPNQTHETAIPIAVARFHGGETVSQLMSRLDSALIEAQQQGRSIINTEAPEPFPGAPSDQQGWRALLTSAIETQQIELGQFTVVDKAGEVLHIESPVRLKLAGEWRPAGQFIGWAGRLGMIRQIDMLAVQAAIKQLQQQALPIGVNLSPESMLDASWLSSLVAHIRQQPTELAKRLWIDIPEYGVFRHDAAFRNLCRTLHPLGVRIGLEHVGPQFARIGQLHDLGLDYAKIDASFIRNIDASTGHQAVARGLCMVGHAMGLQIIAEGVSSAAEHRCLIDLGFDGFTGPGIANR